jgi:hypothetical protein
MNIREFEDFFFEGKFCKDEWWEKIIAALPWVSCSILLGPQFAHLSNRGTHLSLNLFLAIISMN